MLKTWIRRIQSLRIEEIIFLFFLIPSILITIRANWYFYTTVGEDSKKIEGGIARIIVTIILMLIFYWFLWYRPHKRVFKFIRNVAPFIFAIAVYTNLHDTIHFVNPHDVHFQLNAIDEWMFGVSPTVWAEKFYTPWLTDWLSFAYMNYFWIGRVEPSFYLTVQDSGSVVMTRTDLRQEWLCVSRVFSSPGDHERSCRKC